MPGMRLIPQTRWPAPISQGDSANLAYAAPAPQTPQSPLGAPPSGRPVSAPLSAVGQTRPAPIQSPVLSGGNPADTATPHGQTPRPGARHRLRPAKTLARLLSPYHWPSRGVLRTMLPRALALIAACLLAYALLSPPLGFSLPADAATPGDASLSVEPMPFEQPGQSFPGSAFYYLAPEAARQDGASLAPGAHWDNQNDGTGMTIGPVARPLAQVAAPVDRLRALSCLTTAIYYEAATEPDAGQRAVAQVILNRMAHPAFPKTVCGVVYQGSERATGCQFTFTCDGSMARHPMPLFWNRAEAVARAALAGYVYAPVGLATHYHTFQVHPYWDDSVNFIGQIGAHRFYRMQGPAGAPEAFLANYRGGEPVPGPHPRSLQLATHPDVAADPLTLQRAFAAGKVAAAQDLAPAGYTTRATAGLPPPAYTSEVLRRGGDAAYRANNLPASHNVNPEYQNSGRWLGDPQ